MRASSMKSAFLLLVSLGLVVGLFLYRSSSSSQTAGGSTEPADEDQWRLEEVQPGATEEEMKGLTTHSTAKPSTQHNKRIQHEPRRNQLTSRTTTRNVVEAPCSLRSTLRGDPFLRGRFNFSLPVLQWAGSLTRSSWKQLEHQAPPYGWKGIPARVLQASLSLLSSSRLFERNSPGKCVRCAVVGNGGILRGSRQGKNIDGHDLVFRMNGAVIRGFEEDVGTKISFYGFTTNTLKHALSWYRPDGFTAVPQSPEIKYVFIPSDIRDYRMMAAALQGRRVASGRDQGDR